MVVEDQPQCHPLGVGRVKGDRPPSNRATADWVMLSPRASSACVRFAAVRADRASISASAVETISTTQPIEGLWRIRSTPFDLATDDRLADFRRSIRTRRPTSASLRAVHRVGRLGQVHRHLRRRHGFAPTNEKRLSTAH